MRHKSQSKQPTRSDLIQEINRLEDELGEAPTLEDVKKESQYTPHQYYQEFESWTQALEIVGLKPDYGPGSEKVSVSELLSELRRVADIVDRSPRTDDLQEHGKYSKFPYLDRFGSWENALEEAGLDTSYIGETLRKSPGFQIPTGDLIDEMLRVAEIVDRPPFQDDMREYGEYSAKVYETRFGSWGEAHEFAGLPARKRIASASEAEDEFYYGSNWKEQRKKALHRDRFMCQHCGLTNQEHVDQFGHGLNVHHIIPIQEFDEPEEANFPLNLITLCKECHATWEQIGRLGLKSEVSDDV